MGQGERYEKHNVVPVSKLLTHKTNSRSVNQGCNLCKLV
jgi:hypothetical protein